MLLLLTVFVCAGGCLGYIVEIELPAREKSCLQEFLLAGEPISATFLMNERVRFNRFAAYVTIETDKRKVLAQKRFDFEGNSTIITYNNEQTDTLFICIDNFEDLKAEIEIEIKSNNHHAIHEFAPNKEDYAELDRIISDAQLGLDNAFNYFTQNERYAGRVGDKTGELEFRLTTYSLVTLAFVIVVGLVQVRVIKNFMKSKKLF